MAEYNKSDKNLDKMAQDSEIVVMIKDWFEESKRARDPKMDRWRKNENLYHGNHWDTPKPGTSYQTRLVFNFALSNVESILPIMTDYMPNVDVLPLENNDVMFADMLNKRFKKVSEDCDMFQNLILAVKDALIYSNGFMEVMPQFTEEGKFMGFKMSVVDPFTAVPDKMATDLDFDHGKYFIFAVPMYVEDIKDKYGVDGVRGEGDLTDYMAFHTSDQNNLSYEPTDSESQDPEMALVLECYWKDPDYEKYPNGRFSVVCGEILLIDDPLELPRIPVFMLGNYKSAHSFWGQGEPELVRTQSKSFNETMSAIADNIRKAGSPARKITQRAKALLTKPLTGAPGEEIPVIDPNDLTWESPPPLPGYIQNFIQQMAHYTDSVTGVMDVTQGRQPSGVKSGIAIQSLQEASQTRIRFKVTASLNKFVRDIGEYMIKLIQIYDEDTISIRERDPDGNFSFTDYDPVGVYDAQGLPMGSEDFDLSTAKTLKDTNYDIDIVAGNRLPSGRAVNEERALQLFQAGIYGIEEVARDLNEPNKQELIQNFYARMQGQGPQGGGDPEAEAQEEQIMEMFAQLIESGIEPGSPEEEQLLQMLQQYPQLVESEMFNELPNEIKGRLMMVMEAMMQQGQGESGQAS